MDKEQINLEETESQAKKSKRSVFVTLNGTVAIITLALLSFIVFDQYQFHQNCVTELGADVCAQIENFD